MQNRVDEALELARLAALDSLSYEREREEAAEKLGIRVSALDRLVAAARSGFGKAATGQGRPLSFSDIEPWDKPVDGAALLDELRSVFEKYVIMSDPARIATALWTVHTYLFDTSLCTPRLVVKSALKRSGKTTVLTLLTALVKHPLATASLTAAVLYRAVEMAQPCLLIDEADHFAEDGHRQELKALLNAGFQRGGQVLRVIGEDHEPRQFACWCPVALALIGRLWDTLEDRSIRILLQRRRRDEDVVRLRLDGLGALMPLTRRMQRWASDNRSAIVPADPSVPRDLNDRAADCWRPLLAIADQVGGAWPDAARQAAVVLSADEDDLDTVAVRLLRDVKELFQAAPSGVLFSADIVAALLDREERGWAEMGRSGKPLSKVSLARLLERFRIRPGTVRRGNDTAKGYSREQFDDAFSRYL